jgi:hypothetical protein
MAKHAPVPNFNKMKEAPPKMEKATGKPMGDFGKFTRNAPPMGKPKGK